MKKLICSMIAYIFISNLLIAQVEEIQISSECENFNSFRHTLEWDTIKQIKSGTYVDGTIYLNQDSTDDLDLLFQKFSLDEGTSFEFDNETESRIDSNKYYRRYRQLYRNIEVEGGGYTIAYIKHGEPGDPTGPCDVAYMLVPFFLNDFNLQTNPTILSSSLDTILDVWDPIDYKLVISHNIDNECEYNLVWKVSYIEDYPKISLIDAHTGIILSTNDSRSNHNAPTISYGSPKTLTDKTVGSITSLESPDGQLRVFDFHGRDCPLSNNPVNWSTSRIPTTTSTTVWTNESIPNTYQAFWAASQVLPQFSEIGINFKEVNIASCDNANSHSFDGSRIDTAFISIGIMNDRPLALFDVIAHELGHTFLDSFLIYNNGIGNKTLHEGLSDIIGTFIESKIPLNTGVDWIFADDEPLVAEDERVDRDLQNPRDSCFQEVLNEEQHTRGLPLGHWYYLVSQGSTPDEIPSLGLDTALMIIMDAIPMLPPRSDYPDLMNATIKVCLDMYGRCSKQFESVVMAWELICVPTPYGPVVPTCNFNICAPNTVCEEDDYLDVCLCDTPISGADFRWTIIGPSSTDFESQLGMFGNVQEGGDCLTLIDFPKYPYYPQTITIELYTTYVDSITSQHFKRIQRKRIKLIDCRQDDPTCDDYNNMSHNQNQDENSKILSIDRLSFDEKDCIIKVFDLLGRTIFEGNSEDFILNDKNLNTFMAVVYFNKDGKMVATKKIFLLK